MKVKTMSFRVEESIYDKVNAHVKKRNISLSKLIRMLLVLYLEGAFDGIL